MLDSISPYALLCASKPKPAPTIVTAYDLYSQAQRSREQSAPPDASAAVQTPAADTPPAPHPLRSMPAQRTHYIADIKARHSAAIRHAPIQHHPLT